MKEVIYQKLFLLPVTVSPELLLVCQSASSRCKVSSIDGPAVVVMVSEANTLMSSCDSPQLHCRHPMNIAQEFLTHQA